MKKIIKITGIVIGALFILLLVLPFIFKGKIIEIVKKEANNMLNAQLDFSDLSLSFIRNFPNASVSLHDLSLTGINEFDGDTLLSAKEIGATIDLASLFGSKGYEIRSILLDRVKINTIVLADGKANWDIMKADTTTVPDSDTAASSSSFNLHLRKFAIEQTSLAYRDEQANMSARIDNINLLLSGDMTADVTILKATGDMAAITFIMDNIPYLSKAKAYLKIDVEADFQHNKYTLKDNVIRLNALEGRIDGWMALLEKGFDMDISLQTPAIDFKQILSFVPAIYTKDFDGIQASGKVSLSAYAKGKMVDEVYPAFDVRLNVDKGKFQYPDLPKPVDNIAVDLAVSSPGGNLDRTKIDVNAFHFEMAGNPFDLNLHIASPMGNMAFKGGANGKIDLGSIKDIYPLEEGMALNGLLTAGLTFEGNLSQVEKENYEDIKADGTLTLTGMTYQGAGLPETVIDKAVMKFSPRYVEVNPLSVRIGKNDISATGRLEQFIPYVLKNETVKGTLNITSRHFNLNDFMTDSEAPEQTVEDTSALTAFEIPKNIDFVLTAKFNEVLFDSLKMTNVAGKIMVKNGRVDLQNIGMNTLGGTMGLNGYYSTAANPASPEVSLGLNIQHVVFAEAFRSMGMIKQLAPIFENVSGNFSMKLQMKTLLDNQLSPVYNTMNGKGNLSSKEVQVKDVEAMKQLAKLLNNDNLASFSAKDLSIDFAIENGRVHTAPFNIKSGFGNMVISGSSGFDQTLDYTAKIDLPGTVLGTKLAVNAKIGGTFLKPTVGVDTKSLTEQAVTIVKEQVIEVAKDTVNKRLQEEAMKQAEKIKAEAKTAGENLVKEAEKQGQKLIDEANKTSNPLAKIAAVKVAEEAAKKLKSEAEKRAQQLNDEAGKQAQKLIDTARIK